MSAIAPPVGTPLAAAASARRLRLIGLAVIIVAACVLPFVVSNYRTFQFTLVLVYAIALLGLNILTGYNGQISLGHGAFYAIGAYVAAIMMDRMGMPYWATVPVAGGLCLVVGFLFGLPALRLEGHYLALATFALGVTMPQLLKNKYVEHWTGGVQGIVIVKPDAPFGLKLSPDQWLYLFTLAITVVMFVIGWNLIRGRVGRALVAIRDQPIAASAMGIDTALYKSLAFGVSAMYTGVAGALGAIAIQFVAPDSFARRPVDQPAHRHRHRRAGVDPGGVLRGALHPVHSQHRRPDLEGGALGDLRYLPDRVHVPDADGHQRCDPPRLGADAASPQQASPARRRLIHRRHPETIMSVKHLLASASAAVALAVAATPAAAQKKYDPGASDTEIKIGQTMPYSGPASAYGTIGKAEAAYFKMINEQGGINGRKINFISLDDAYSPPKTVEMVRRLVEQDEVLLVFQTLGTPSNTAIQKYMQGEEGSAALRRDRRDQVERPGRQPVDDGLAAELPDRDHDLREAHPEGEAEREDRRALPERRLRQGLPEGPEGRPRRQGQVDDRGRGLVRGQRADRRLADRPAPGLRCRRLRQHHHPEVRRAGDPQGLRHRLEAAPLPEQRVGAASAAC